MRSLWHDLWGAGRGPMRRRSPGTRILAGAGVMAAVLSAPAATSNGLVAVTVITGGWLLACRPPIRVFGRLVCRGSAILLPPLLLVLGLAAVAHHTDLPALARTMFGVLVRGLAAMLVSTLTASCLEPAEIRTGLLSLPVPSLVAMILVEMVQGVRVLGQETVRVAEAIAVRGAASGWLLAWQLIVSLPQVWLTRVVVRAERVAAAMELRGYLRAEDRSGLDRGDRVTLLLVAATLAAALLVRCYATV